MTGAQFVHQCLVTLACELIADESEREAFGSSWGAPKNSRQRKGNGAPLRCLVNRFQRHSRATTSQVCSANSFMDFPIPQTLED